MAADELHEEALRALVTTLDEAGDRAQALQVYRRFRDRLRTELDAEPSRETELLARRLGSSA
jgi:DNA-binding SARP family transcriptional activator